MPYEDLNQWEKIELVNDKLTNVLEDYVHKRNKYVELADEHYASGRLDAPTVFEQEYNAYREAKRLMMDLITHHKSVNEMVRLLDDFELI